MLTIMEMEHRLEVGMEQHMALLDQKIKELKEMFDQKADELHNELMELKKLYHEGKTNVKNDCH